MSAYSPQELWEIVEEWIDVAERDLLAARRLCAEELLTDIAAFRLQSHSAGKGQEVGASDRAQDTEATGVTS